MPILYFSFYDLSFSTASLNWISISYGNLFSLALYMLYVELLYSQRLYFIFLPSTGHKLFPCLPFIWIVLVSYQQYETNTSWFQAVLRVTLKHLPSLTEPCCFAMWPWICTYFTSCHTCVLTSATTVLGEWIPFSSARQFWVQMLELLRIRYGLRYK